MKESDIIPLGNILYGKYHYGFGYNVISPHGICFTLTQCTGGGRTPIIQITHESK